MKVPLGYGNCQITFDAGCQPDNISYIVYFKIDQSSWYEVDEWAERHVTLARSKEKDIYGYHFNFDLKLYDNNLISAGTQNTLLNFFHYYNRSTYSDKRFYLEPYRGGTNPESLKGRFEVISIGYPKLSNVAETTRAKGQYLHLKCETKFIMDRADYDYMRYRETSDDSWGILPATSNIGQGELPVGEGILNKITVINDQDFSGGTIGNWVAYTDGLGTAVYDGTNPHAEKVAIITVHAGTPGTYTGMSLPTGDISAFVDGETYQIRADIQIKGGANNFTKISALPTNMTGWTKVREEIADITIEDKWQTISAVYTAAADVTGEISFKGESTTASDIYYIDNIEIFKV